MFQVMQCRWDPAFSPHSYGFCPGRSQHQAVAAAQSYIRSGYDYVVDMDIEKFFDRQTEGTPQGGPLSPLLSNLVLDELVGELSRRGLHLVRYADD